MSAKRAAGPWKPITDEKSLPPPMKTVLWNLPGDGAIAGFLLGEESPFGPAKAGLVYPGFQDPKSFTHWAEVIFP